MLRKTTFDECKGEKFEELLSGFANLVLRQVLYGRNSKTLPLSAGCEANRLPLLIAHRVLLKARLDQRQNLAAKIVDHEQDISDRRAWLSYTRKQLERHRSPEQHIHDDAESLLRDAWTANPAWADALLRDFPIRSNQPSQKKSHLEQHGGRSVLQVLEDSITKHQTQLSRWESVKASLPAINARPSEARHQARKAQSVPFFDKHKELHAGHSVAKSPKDTLETSNIQRQYDALLTDLNNALSSDEAAHSARDLVADARRNNSPEPAALEPVSARRLPPNASASSNVSIDPSSAFPNDRNDPSDHHPMQQSPAPRSTPLHESTSVRGLPDDETISPELSRLAAAPLPTVVATTRSSSPEEVDDTEQSEQTLPLPTHFSGRGHTLQERTRMSLAGALRDTDSIPSSPIRQEQKPSKQEDAFSASPLENRGNEGSLAQRTRKSMSLLTTIADMKTNRRKSKGPRTSQLYPVDPFETPRRSSSQISLGTPGSNDSTPREKLFSDDADITSVFKSRPKIALSPLISPTRSSLEENSFVVPTDGDLSFDEDDIDLSPTRG